MSAFRETSPSISSMPCARSIGGEGKGGGVRVSEREDGEGKESSPPCRRREEKLRLGEVEAGSIREIQGKERNGFIEALKKPRVRRRRRVAGGRTLARSTKPPHRVSPSIASFVGAKNVSVRDASSIAARMFGSDASASRSALSSGRVSTTSRTVRQPSAATAADAGAGAGASAAASRTSSSTSGASYDASYSSSSCRSPRRPTTATPRP